ncbi:MAG: alpha/beta hydrolase [Salinibacterium sp.]|nr:alpha/beta hydrolase [Salinibacterium sp.]MBF0673130.1 alpha/beta hydrolase [Salinibacterium sp.]
MPSHTTPPWFDPAPYDSGLRHELVSSGVRIRYRTGGNGDGPRILFVHGGRAHAAWWAHQIALLGPDTPKWAALDLSGHGDSEWREHYRAELWLGEVQDVAAALGADDELILVGHSLGGMLSILTAASGAVPAIRHVVSVDAVPLVPGDAPARAEQSASTPSYRGLGDGIAAFADRSARQHWPRWLARFIGERSLRPHDGGWTWRHDTAPRIIERPVIQEFDALDLSRLTLVSGRRSPYRDSLLASGFLRRAGDELRHFSLDAGHDVMMEQPEEFHALLVGELALAEAPR